MRQLTFAMTLLTFAGCGGGNSPPAPSSDVTLSVVTFPELLRILENHKGKLVVMDFWAHY